MRSHANRPQLRAWVTGAAALAAAVGLAAGSAPSRAAFPGTNGVVVFSSNRPAPDGSTDFEIYSMQSSGADIHQLTDNAAAPPSAEGGTGEAVPIDDSTPAISPNGKEIAFSSNRPAADGKTVRQIYVMNIDGSDVRQVTHDAPGSGSGNNYEPAWSPDGRQIVYRHNDGRLADLYIVDLASGQETRLVTPYDRGPAAYDGQPSWSPDGTEIVFRKGMGTSADIWVYNLLAGDAADAAHMLIHDPSAPESAPSWSPNGRQIVYVRGDEGAGGGIWVANANGGDQHPLTEPQANAEGLLYSDLAPRWSPDGRQIIFASTRDGILTKPETDTGSGETGGGHSGGPEEGEEPLKGAVELFTINSDGTGLTRLTQATSLDGPQDLSPDWQTIPTPPEATVPVTPTPPQLAAPVVEVPVQAAPGPSHAVCLSRRVERIQVRVTRRDIRRLWSWRVSIDGRRVHSWWRGTTLVASADLRHLGRPQATVAVTIWLTHMVRLSGRRTYELCSGARGGVSTFHLMRQTRPVVRLTVATLSGHREAFAGSVTPAHHRQAVMIQRMSASGWATIATAQVRIERGRGTYRLVVRSPMPGIYRAHIAQDRTLLDSSSRPVRLS